MEVSATESAALIGRAKARGSRIILNLAPAHALPEASLRLIDMLVVNETEAEMLAQHLRCEATAPALRARLSVDVVRTLGAEGLEAATGAGTQRMPARQVVPVDTTAAGDCFVGVLAAALDRNMAPADAFRRATIAAALCCTRSGSQSSLPTASEIDACA
jgi:ribokinase